MKTQTVWVLPDNNKASNPVAWVDSANPQFQAGSKGGFIPVQARILNSANIFNFDDDVNSDYDSGNNTKTIIMESLMPVLGCSTQTTVSIGESDVSVTKKKRPLSYLFLKKPSFSNEPTPTTEDSDVSDPIIQFEITGTNGALSSGGQSTTTFKTMSVNGTNRRVPVSWQNFITVFFMDKDNNIVCRESDGLPIKLVIMLGKGNVGDPISTTTPQFSGGIWDDNSTPAYTSESQTYGMHPDLQSPYKTWYGALNNGGGVTVAVGANKITVQGQINHTFEKGTKVCIDLQTAALTSFYPGSSSPFKDTALPLGVADRMEMSGNSVVSVKKTETVDGKLRYKEGYSPLIEPIYFNNSINMTLDNPNKENDMNTNSDGHVWTDGRNAVLFSLAAYDFAIRYNTSVWSGHTEELSSFFSASSGSGGGSSDELLTENTPCWTFLNDIRRVNKGGKMVMKGTIRYLSYMADLQPEGDDYRDFEPYEIGE